MTWVDRILSVPTTGKRLSAMEGLRGYAALLIYVLHLTGQYFDRRHDISMDALSFGDLRLDQPLEIVSYWLFSSHYGVDIFFVLSGYLIAGLVLRDDFRYGPYLINRLLRIYPVLISSTFIYVFYRIVINGGSVWWGGIAGNLLLLNGIEGLEFPAINIVTWSLFFEITFYLVFPLLWFGCGRNLMRFAGCALCLVALLTLFSDNYSRYAMFIAGVVLRTIPEITANRIRRALPDAAVVVLYLAAAASFMVTKQFAMFLPMFLVPAFLFIDRAVHSEGRLNRIFSNRWLRYFGNISFSFYIYHPLGLSIAHVVLDGYQHWTDAGYLVTFAVVSFSTSNLLAILSYVFIERRYFSSRRHAVVPSTQQA